MRLVDIRRYPVKSLRGHALASARVDRIGLVDDRRWMVVDAAGQFQTQRQMPRMARIDATLTAVGVGLGLDGQGTISVERPGAGAESIMVRVWSDDVPARSAAPEADAWLSRALGAAVRLVYLDDETARGVDLTFGQEPDRVSFADGFPILLTTEESHGALNARLAVPVTMTRFRPNLVVAGFPAWEEDRWRRIRIGEASFRIVKPCARCIITTLDPVSGEKTGDEPLRTLGKIHRASGGRIIFGQNLIPDELGAVRVGDAVEVLEAGPSNVV
jgi:uncharacterized protein YcbX